MQIVSEAYKDSMKSLLRNMGYIEVSIDVDNLIAQENAHYNFPDPAYFSGDITEEVYLGEDYVTFEKNFNSVDGTMVFLPSDGDFSHAGNYGFCSDELINENDPYIFVVSFGYIEGNIQNPRVVEVTGLEINFGENYAMEFTITNGTVTKQYTNNKPLFFTADEFPNSVFLRFIVSNMKNDNTRLRIKHIRFGFSVIYGNDDVIDSTYEYTASPISEVLPQQDFNVNLVNRNNFFDIENPDSLLNLFQKGQTLNIKYGYELPDGIEWVKGGTVKLSSWDADEDRATLTAEDILRSKSEIFYKSKINQTYKQLIIDVLTDCGITDYTIDNSLGNYSTTVPVPCLSHKEVLQLAANACFCAINITRDGGIEVKPLSPENENTVYDLEKHDMLSRPLFKKNEGVKEISVFYYEYVMNSTSKELVREVVSGVSGNNITYYFENFITNYSCTFGGSSSNVTIIHSGPHYVEIEFNITDTMQLIITGYEMESVERQIRTVVGDTGESIVWKNPLIDSKSAAQSLSAKLVNYFSVKGEYECDYRGNPELDMFDVVKQENPYNNNLKTYIVSSTLDFNGAFSGKLTTRCVEEE